MLKISLGIEKYPEGYLGAYSDAKDLYLKLKGQGKGESFIINQYGVKTCRSHYGVFL